MASTSPANDLAVWNRFCNAYRDALFNEMYYADRLARVRKRNRAANLIIAAGATGSPLLTWGVWTRPNGKVALTAFTSFVAIVALLYERLDWPKDLERYSKLREGYQSIASSLLQIIARVQFGNAIDEQLFRNYEKIVERATELARDRDLEIDPGLAEKLYEDVIIQSKGTLGGN